MPTTTLEGLRDPFWTHHVAPGAVRRAWRRGEAAVVELERPIGDEVRVVVVALGPRDDLAPALDRAAAETDRPWNVMLPEPHADLLPPAWRPARARCWHWMLTRESPTSHDAEVAEVADPDAVAAVLDAAYAESHARPGTAGIEAWLGIRAADGVLAGVGALARQHDGTGNLRGVAVLPSYAGQGLGTRLSSALTRRALAGASGTATLGVFVDNPAALAIYERLGYTRVHTFYAGVLG